MSTVTNVLDSALCAVYSGQYTLWTVQCTVYSVHCTLYNVHCTLDTGYCTLYILHCPLYTLYIPNTPWCTVPTAVARQCHNDIQEEREGRDNNTTCCYWCRSQFPYVCLCLSVCLSVFCLSAPPPQVLSEVRWCFGSHPGTHPIFKESALCFQ